MSKMQTQSCHFCTHDGGEILASNALLRMIAPHEPEFPGLIRVVWNAHIAEMTDLPPEQRSAMMQVVCQVEQLIRDVLRPHKVNLASFGNFVPHLHWHVIPRWEDDSYFPESIWGVKLREVPAELLKHRHEQAEDLFEAIRSFDFKSKYNA
jgi:diadenosine tetraphosphate (Ap4A) HIT family hydrolase